MESNIRIDRLPKGRGTDRETDISLASGSDNIISAGSYHDPRAVCLSWFLPPYQYLLCLLHCRPESDTHNINAQKSFKESRNLQVTLHISNYCVYCIEDQNLTHTI